MPWTRPLAEGTRLIRPLLGVRRGECESMCAAAGVSWQVDPGNADVRRARARLRHDVMPVLHELWPDAARRATATAEAVRAAAAALERQVVTAFGPASARSWPRAVLVDLPMAAAAAGLRRAAIDARPDLADDLGQKLVLLAAMAIMDGDRRPRQFDWPGGQQLRITTRRVELVDLGRSNGHGCTA